MVRPDDSEGGRSEKKIGEENKALHALNASPASFVLLRCIDWYRGFHNEALEADAQAMCFSAGVTNGSTGGPAVMMSRHGSGNSQPIAAAASSGQTTSQQYPADNDSSFSSRGIRSPSKLQQQNTPSRRA